MILDDMFAVFAPLLPVICSKPKQNLEIFALNCCKLPETIYIPSATAQAESLMASQRSAAGQPPSPNPQTTSGALTCPKNRPKRPCPSTPTARTEGRYTRETIASGSTSSSMQPPDEPPVIPMQPMLEILIKKVELIEASNIKLHEDNTQLAEANRQLQITCNDIRESTAGLSENISKLEDKLRAYTQGKTEGKSQHTPTEEQLQGTGT
ncbi:hypothetical protein ACJ73_08365 [Blastomyces percursus]|uniref:Uncharacterized protein n=1 Tax=Blastomyces percursus TaxID=1658174 RepID=A0A1J9QYA6_9EURO|nr:hypothetical protein ACJ73_08365 [Blastomyces percursus]